MHSYKFLHLKVEGQREEGGCATRQNCTFFIHTRWTQLRLPLFLTAIKNYRKPPKIISRANSQQTEKRPSWYVLFILSMSSVLNLCFLAKSFLFELSISRCRKEATNTPKLHPWQIHTSCDLFHISWNLISVPKIHYNLTTPVILFFI